MASILRSLLFLFVTSSVLGLTSCSSDLSSNTPPEGLTVTWPQDQGHVNAVGLTMTGACKSGTTITISGNVVGSPVTASCSSSSGFSSALTLSAGQGVKTLSVIQTASDNTSSDPVELSVTLDTVAPAVPTITAPAANARLNQFSQSISGACESQAEVRVTGNVLQPPRTGSCIGGTYSVGVTFVAGQGTKTFNVAQRDRAGNTSTAVSRSVVIDTVAPAPPAYTAPAANAFVNNATQTFTGTCEAAATVLISGALVNAPLETTCTSGGTFSRSVTFIAGQGTKTTAILQRDVAGNSSTAVGRNFTLDTVNPIAPTITSPAAGATVTTRNITVTGRCEAAATVTVAGAGVTNAVSATCTSAGAYSRTIQLTANNGTKALSVTQRDRATNNSPAATRNITMTVPGGMSSGLSRSTASNYVSGKNNDLESKSDLKLVYENLAHTIKKQNSKCLEKALMQNQDSEMSDALILDLTQRILEGEFSGVEISNDDIMKSIFDEEGRLTSLSEDYLILMEKECNHSL